MPLLLRSLRAFVTLAVVFFSLASASFAQSSGLTFTVNPVQQSGSAGGSVVFTGTITNNTGFEVFLDSLSTNFAVPGFTADPNVFDNNVPLSLADGEFTSGALFGLTLSPALSGGIYTGTATLSASSNSPFSFTLTQNIQVNVLSTGTTAAPEPGSAALLGSLLAVPLLGVVSRKIRSHKRKH